MSPETLPALTLARVLRPWGRRGEVAAEILTDFTQRLTKLREVWLSDGRTPPRAVAVRSCRIHLGQAVFHFAGPDSISDAERLRGLEVQVPFEARMALRPGRHYIGDLVGCEVWDLQSGALLGIVQDAQGAGPRAAGVANEMASWLLVVGTADGELLIPLAAEICPRIDTAARRIEVRLPEGLRELNAKPRKL